MKQKMYLFLMLAAALFASCSNDDDNGGKETPPPSVSFDYSSLINMSYADMIRQYPEPSMQFGDLYFYESVKADVEALSIAINPEDQTVYMVIETLKEGVYEEATIDAYFKGKYHSYGVIESDDYDEEGNVVGTYNTYSYGNNEDIEKATLVITYFGTSISYMNPLNVPAEPEGGALEDMTPIEAVNAFILGDVAEIQEEYPDVFSQMGDMYAAFMEENPYLMGVAFTPVDGFVESVVILYNEELDDAAIMAYYEENGYTCTKTGVDEEGLDVYTITDELFSIEYSGGRGVATFVGEL